MSSLLRCVSLLGTGDCKTFRRWGRQSARRDNDFCWRPEFPKEPSDFNRRHEADEAGYLSSFWLRLLISPYTQHPSIVPNNETEQIY